MLDSMDGGAKVNILLEGGPKFIQDDLNYGNELHPIDQAILLSICLDVQNHNPVVRRHLISTVNRIQQK